jgi:hypothetical protein
VKRLPKHVSVKWDLFNERVERVPTTTTDPAGPFRSTVQADDPIIEWRNYLFKYQEPKVSAVMMDDGRSIGIPVLSVLLMGIALGAALLAAGPAFLSRRIWATVSALGVVAAVLLIRIAVVDVGNPFAGPPDEKVSAQILTRVLKNVNVAYLEKEPVAVRQALGEIVAGDALADVEVELGRALTIKVAGGGIARVKSIENLTVKDITALEGVSGFRSVAEWTAIASGGHWGHAHRRKIRFRALVELVEINNAWKIAGITVVDVKTQS